MEHEEKKTVGQLLRAAREARGISRDAAAASTGIKSIFLTAMEEDDYHLLPDERYLLRFLEEYATFLGLDPQGVERCFAQQIAGGRGSLAIFPVKRTVTLSVRRLLPALLLLAFFIPSVFVALSLLSNPAQEGQRPERPERPEMVGGGAPAGTLPRTGGTVAANRVATAAPGRPPAAASSAAEGAAYTLRAQAQEMTWMLVTIDGRETRDVLLRAGETWEWHADEGFVVTLGNAGGVELILNGRSLPQLGAPGQVVRDLHLPAGMTPSAESP
ncbi:MAG: helix-turn-helix domain-containing protein [Candidatus Methylomirabilales bacterium]